MQHRAVRPPPSYRAILSAMVRAGLLSVLLSASAWSAGCAGPNPAGSALGAELYRQTSAEYEALCRQVYAAATAYVKGELAAAKVGGGSGRPAMIDGKPVAVVLDIDETVLDNAVFQTRQYDEAVAFSEALFVETVTQHADDIGVVPGAKEFLAFLEENGVTPVYITNRTPATTDATIASFLINGLPTGGLKDADGRRLLFKVEGSDKDARRKFAGEKYTIIGFVGDQLTDFPGPFSAKARPTVEDRRAEVRKHAAKWNRGWFLLPNATYGEWQRVLDPADPAKALKRAGAAAPAPAVEEPRTK